MAPPLPLVPLVLVREAVDLRALGVADDAGGDRRACQLDGGCEHDVAVDQVHRPQRHFVAGEALDLDVVTLSDPVLLATGWITAYMGAHNSRTALLEPGHTIGSAETGSGGPTASVSWPMALRVVIAEDNLLVREGVVKLLDHQAERRGRGHVRQLRRAHGRGRARRPGRRRHRHPDATDGHRRRHPRRAQLRERTPTMGVVVLQPVLRPGLRPRAPRAVAPRAGPTC